MNTLHSRLLEATNRTAALNSQPFDRATSTATPRGRWGIVHYGVMVPGLPQPLRFFDAIVVLGSARAPIFDNRSLIETTAKDTAWILTGSGVTTDSFRPYSIANECNLTPDGSRLSFGKQVRIERRPDLIDLETHDAHCAASLQLRPTAVVSHFAHLPGVYDHWSMLCEYSGTFEVDGAPISTSGLCTYEYARAVNAPLPFLRFTYQILNLDERTQVLFTEVLGPKNVTIQRTAYLRCLDDGGTNTTHPVSLTVHANAPAPLTTPDGTQMLMPKTFTWCALNPDGTTLLEIDGATNDDFVYGLAAGYVGSYEYTGTFRGRSVGGTGYIEWIDRRKGNAS